jgi:phosphatidylglycerol:prolipoprotein diacylglycerol transferase
MMVVFFLFFYGIFRFFLEFFREPDPQLGFVLGPLTMGQLLCLAMVIMALVLAVVLKKMPAGNQGPTTAGKTS